MELDVATPGLAPAQVPAGKVTVGQLDLEDVVAARFAFVAGAHARRAGLVVDRDIVVDNPAVRVARIDRVTGDRRGLHVHPVTVVDVVQVAPERTVLDTAGHAEVGLRPRRRAGNPTAARQEIPATGRR